MTDDISNHPSPFTFAEEPLTIVKGNDGKDYLKYESELYGFIAGDMLTMYNDPEEDTLHGMTYKVKDIQRIRTDDVGKVRIELKTGDEYTHRKAAGKDEDYTIVKPPEYIPADENDLWNTRRLILHMFPDLADCMYKDILRDRLMINCAMIGEPDKIVPYEGKNSIELSRIRNIIETYTETRTTENGKAKLIRFKSNKDNTNDALMMLADMQLRNPFIDRIKRVHWDGIERIDNFLSDIGCDARLSEELKGIVYLKIVSRGIFLSVLERQLDDMGNFTDADYKPIQFVPVIIGDQGAGKTTLCRKIGLDWYRSTNVSFEQQKKFYESVQGGVIVELKEGTQMQKDTVESMKAFADETRLQYRKSYGVDASSGMKIMFTMIATTNDEQILKDDTGNRRFYPVYMIRTESALKYIEDYTDDEILQMWAEALHLYKQGERWDSRIYDPEIAPIIREVQVSATQNYAGHDEILNFLNTECPNIGDWVTLDQVRECLRQSTMYYGATDIEKIILRVSRSIGTFGFKNDRIKRDGIVKRGYRRIR